MGKRKPALDYAWLIGSIFLGIAFVINLFIPDPVPYIDEILLLVGTIWSSREAIK